MYSRWTAIGNQTLKMSSDLQSLSVDLEIGGAVVPTPDGKGKRKPFEWGPQNGLSATAVLVTQ